MSGLKDSQPSTYISYGGRKVQKVDYKEKRVEKIKPTKLTPPKDYKFQKECFIYSTK